MTKSPAWMQLAAVAAGRWLRMVTAAATATAVLAIAGLFAGVASAKGETLRFYQVGGTQFYNAAGHPISLNPPVTLPKPGESFDEADIDYAGTAKHHATHWTVSDHLTCKFTSADTGRCNVQIAIGGSMLLSNNFTLDFQRSASVVAISEGTGAFRGIHGSFTVVDLPKSNDAVLTIHLS